MNKNEVRGRPVKSVIRQNLIEILYFLGDGYAYEIYKIYSNIFPRVTMRSVYYHLKKGVNLGIFKIKEIRKEQGQYSWGPQVEKIYYSLDKWAEPAGNLLVKDYLNQISRNS